MKLPRLIILAVAAAVIFMLPAGAVSKEPEAPSQNIKICIVVGSSPDAVVMQWYPLISYLTKEVGRSFDIVIKDSYEEMLKSYKNGEIDLLLSGPLNYVKTKNSDGAVLVAASERPKEERFHGVIVVNGKSPFKSLSDLKGKRFAFTEPYSTTGYLLPRIMMAKEGINQPSDFFKEVVFSGHHSDALDAVIDGRVDAASVVSYLVPDAIRKRGADLRIIATTPELPPEPVFARPTFSSEIISRIRDALIHMHERVPPDVMKELGVVRFTEVNDRTYDPVRSDEKILLSLPKIPYSIDYTQMPKALASSLNRWENKGFNSLMALPAGIALLFVLCWFVFRKKVEGDVRLKFASAIFAVMLLVSFAVAYLSSRVLHRQLEGSALEWQRNIGIFSGQAAKFTSDEGGNVLGSLVDGLAKQPGVLYVKVIKNGQYIADSLHQDKGYSVIPKIIAGTFKPKFPDSIDAVSYVSSGDARWALVQIGLDAGVFEKAFKRAFFGNAAVVVSMLAVGLILAWLLSFVVTRPIIMLTRAVNEVRAGRRPGFDFEFAGDQLGSLVKGFREMEIALAQRDEMLGLKAVELERATEHIRRLKDSEAEIEEAISDAEENLSAQSPVVIDVVKRELSRMSKSQSDEQIDELRTKIETVEKEIPALKKLRSERVIGDSPAFLKVIRDIIIRSRDSEPVLLHGASGSGKTGVAFALHELSSRSSNRIVEYNCAELAAADPVIVLGKLFGYGKDCGIAGVNKDGQPGLLEECDGTTLFLDEISLLPMQTQGALLLPIEGRPFNPAAGKGAPRKVDVRFIFAANEPLEDAVSAGRFRNDLLRRIRSRGCIEIPMLKERPEDIVLLADHFLKMWEDEKGVRMSLSKDAMELLQDYDYRRFNVAELASSIKVAADNAHFKGFEVIDARSFEGEIAKSFSRDDKAQGIYDADEMRELSVLRKHDFEIARCEAVLGFSRDSKTLTNHLRGMVIKSLALSGWNADGAADVLAESSGDIARRRIRRKIDIYLENISKLSQTSAKSRLFNNLPQKYHRFMEEAIARTIRP